MRALIPGLFTLCLLILFPQNSFAQGKMEAPARVEKRNVMVDDSTRKAPRQTGTPATINREDAKAIISRQSPRRGIRKAVRLKRQPAETREGTREDARNNRIRKEKIEQLTQAQKKKKGA
ncbi:hypothetical protein [Lewinella sp. W8]|uniref:hypothetical protein n=1 Tax=Lewinella sp. W8 TaxID=2528208 RepID=UPI001067D7BE|nr:hypothetical protein [Lewinella sp. W8]MTB52990.1 hypothetical protein [Lewinella sp. W8]